MERTPTGVEGLDHILQGGLPRGRTTIVEGGPGSGKTTLSLQALACGGEASPAIFVAFEDSIDRVKDSARNFGWNVEGSTTFIDAQPDIDAVVAGDFSLEGLLAVLSVKIDGDGVERVVFDALDVALSLLDDPKKVRRELYRLHQWLRDRKLTAIVTTKDLEPGVRTVQAEMAWTCQYLMDCHIRLFHALDHGVSQRALQVTKMRGDGFDENLAPFVFGAEGIEVASLNRRTPFTEQAPTTRLSTGIERLDTLTGGGYFQRSAVLITGAPGTAKTTLAGSFARAACKADERVLYISFDSAGEEVVRNLRSVNIDLSEAREQGRLELLHLRAVSESAERHLLTIRRSAQQLGATCLVLDPISALAAQGNEDQSRGVIVRLLAWAKINNITVLATSLLERGAIPGGEGTDLHISTIADTWIHLSYASHGGERNRAISVIKSRGTAHSNQVRELVLSEEGVDLASVYSAEGEVFMGSLRAQKEAAQAEAERRAQAEASREEARLRAEIASLGSQLESLRHELTSRRDDLALAIQGREEEASQLSRDRRMRERRRGIDRDDSLERSGD